VNWIDFKLSTDNNLEITGSVIVATITFLSVGLVDLLPVDADAIALFDIHD
jgi:hypothetical protein